MFQDVVDVLNQAEQYESIEISSVSFENVKAVLEACGNEAKEFKWEPHADFFHELVIVKTSEIVELLSMLPKLESFTLNLLKWGFQVKLCEVKSVKLKLKALHLLAYDAQNLSKLYKFFSRTLYESSIVEHSIIYFPNNGKERAEFDLKFRLRKFFAQQNSIKTFMTNYLEILESAKDLVLDGLELLDQFNWWNLQIVELLRSQSKLKTFKFEGEKCEFMNEIGELSELETLSLKAQFNGCTKFKNLKNLKDIHLTGDASNFFKYFENEKRQSLRRMRVDMRIEGSSEMLENLSNLTHVKLNFNQKLNTRAKFLPKLEELQLTFEAINFKFIELDTGIVNESLKKLEINFRNFNFNENIEEVLEIFEIFPNIEDLKLLIHKSKFEKISNSRALVEENFFERLGEVESLKTLELLGISLVNFTNDFAEIAAGLKKLRSRKHVRVRFESTPYWEVVEEEERRKDFTYQPLIEMLKDDFEIEYLTPINIEAWTKNSLTGREELATAVSYHLMISSRK